MNSYLSHRYGSDARRLSQPRGRLYFPGQRPIKKFLFLRIYCACG